MEQTYLGVYAQDTWRLGSRLTVNYGLRWEPFFPQQLRNGAVYQFDMARFKQNIHSTVFPNGPAGLYFPGDPGFPTKAGMEKQWKNFGPRVGVAWDPTGDGRTSIRASYGKSYEFVNGAVPPQHVGRAAVGLGSAASTRRVVSTIRSSAVRRRPTSFRSRSIRTRRSRSTGRSSA